MKRNQWLQIKWSPTVVAVQESECMFYLVPWHIIQQPSLVLTTSFLKRCNYVFLSSKVVTISTNARGIASWWRSGNEK